MTGKEQEKDIDKHTSMTQPGCTTRIATRVNDRLPLSDGT